MNIRNKLVIPITSLVIVFAVFAVLAMNRTVNGVVTTQTDTFRDYTQQELAAAANARKNTIYSSLDRLGTNALQQAAFFSEQPDIQNAYRIALSGDINDESDPQMQQGREELRRVMAPYIAGYKKNTGADAFSIHFHTPNARSLARLWRDGWQTQRNGKKLDVSDDLSSFRNTVIQINQGNHAPLKGIEIGRGGFALRGLAPVTDTTGQHLGSCEVLLPFADVIAINHVDDSYQIAAYMLSDLLPIATKLQDPAKYPVLDGKYVLTAATDPELTKQVLTSGLLDAGRNQDSQQIVGDRFVSTFPIPDFSGKVVGVMALIYDMGTINAVTAAAEQRRVETLQAVNWRFGIGALVLATVLFGTIFQVTRMVVRPLNMTITAAKQIAVGDLPEAVEYHGKDEVGTLADAVNQMIASLKRKAEEATRIAKGDLRLQVAVSSDRDVMGQAFREMARNLNEVLGEIDTASAQIDSGSDQVANTAQYLSEGAMQSAASLEEITSSMNEIGSQTRHSADNAEQANQLAQTAQDAARTGSERMTEMVAAMNEINEAGQSINNIIKVIDEIAFQTNLLALNAAVEAARAGQHGKGFAVVAEEVRSLAARSAKAAEETAQLIQGSVEKAANGGKIASRTSEALAEIVEASTQVTGLVGEIAKSANEQAHGIGQINQGLEQIDAAVQRSTATAQESAAASEELSSQSALLKQMLGRFQLAESSRGARTKAASRHSAVAAAPEWEELEIQGADSALEWDDAEYAKVR